MLVIRTLFFLCIAFCCYFFLFQLSNFSISTHLSDLSPDIAPNPAQQHIINEFNGKVQQRFILLLKSNNKNTAQQASTTLQKMLGKIDNINITTDDPKLANKIASTFLPFKHQLLTDAQQSEIETLNINKLSHIAKERLYQFDSALRILPFKQDPLGYLNDFVLTFSNKLRNNQTILDKNSIVVPAQITKKNLSLAEQTLLFNRIKKIENAIETEFNVDILHSGLFFFAAEAAIDSRADVEFISTGSTICILVLLLFAFRSFKPLLLPSISIVLGVIFATAVTYSLFNSLHILTIVFGASLIGIVIDYSLHFFYHHANQLHQKHGSLYRALLLSLITSLIGYSALSLSSLEALRKIALFSCCGLIMAWLTVIVLGRYLLNAKLRTDKYLLPVILNNLTPLFPKRKSYLFIFLGFVFSATFILFYLKGINTNDSPALFYKTSAKLIEEEKFVSQQVQQYEPGRFFIIEGSSQDDIRKTLNHLRLALKKLDSNVQLFNIADILPDIQSQKDSYRIQKKLYQNNGVIEHLYQALQIDSKLFKEQQDNYLAAAQKTLSPLALSQNLPELLPTWFTYNNNLATIVLISHGSDTTTFTSIAEKIARVSFISSIDMSSKVLSQQRHAAIKTLALAFILIAVLLLLYYKQLSSLLALLIPATAILVTFLYLIISQETVTLFHIMALFLVLGLGMDYVIFSREMTDNKDITQQAILLSAITTSISFGFLSMSTIPIAESFGLTILIGNNVNLIGALLYSHFYSQPLLSKA